MIMLDFLEQSLEKPQKESMKKFMLEAIIEITVIFVVAFSGLKPYK